MGGLNVCMPPFTACSVLSKYIFFKKLQKSDKKNSNKYFLCVGEHIWRSDEVGAQTPNTNYVLLQ